MRTLRPFVRCGQAFVCRRQIVSMPPILPRSAFIDSSGDRLGDAKRDVISPAVAPARGAVFQDAGFIEEQAADGAFVEQPEIRQLLWRKMPLESGVIDADW